MWLVCASAIDMAAVCLFDFVICHAVNVCEQVNGRFIGVLLTVAMPITGYAINVFAAGRAKVIFLVFHFVSFLPPLPGGSACHLVSVYRGLPALGKVCQVHDWQ